MEEENLEELSAYEKLERGLPLTDEERQNLQMADDLKEIEADLTPKEKLIPYKGKVYRFLIKELPWKMRNRILGESIDQSNPRKPVFKNDIFMIKVANAIVVEGPAGWDKSSVHKLNEEFGAVFEKLVAEHINFNPTEVVSKKLPEGSEEND